MQHWKKRHDPKTTRGGSAREWSTLEISMGADRTWLAGRRGEFPRRMGLVGRRWNVRATLSGGCSWSGYERVGTQEAGSMANSNRVHGEILRSGGNAWTREEDKDHSRIILEPGKERINKTRILGFKGHEISHEIHPEIKYIIYTSPYYTRIDTVR